MLLADQRREHLGRAGVSRSGNWLADYEDAGLKFRVTSASGRGNSSPEAALIQEARNRRRRAEKCGFHSIEDRCEHDLQFMERMLQMGYDFRGAQRQDFLCHCHLANPPRSRAQVSLGLGYDDDHTLARLAYVDVVPEQFTEAMDYIVDQWCIFYRTNVLSLREYSEYIKTPKAHRNLLAWDGVHVIDLDQPMVNLRQICDASHAAARQDVINKIGQEQRQQQAKGKRKSTTKGGAQPPSSVSPTAATSSSSWGWRSRDWSEGWSQWGEQRLWSRGAWDWSSSESWGRWR